MNLNNKRAVENWLVAKSTTTMPTTGTLNNTSTGVVNLADGQLGIVSDSIYGTKAMNAFVDSTPTFAETPVIAIYQGTADSANPAATSTYPLSTRPYERSGSIDGRNSVITMTKEPYRAGTSCIWAVGGPGSDPNAINVLDETEYALRIAYRGYRIEEFFSSEEAASTRASITTPDFTSLGTAEPGDWIVNYLGWNINRNSQALNIPTRFAATDPIVALAVTETTSGATAISSLAPGDFLPVVNTQFGIRGITLTTAQHDALDAAATASGFTHFITIDLANAGTTTGGVGEGLFLIALDSPTAYLDYIPQVETRLQVGLTAGFDTNVVLNAEQVAADPGAGIARKLDLLYKETQGQRKYNLRHEEIPVVEYPSPIDLSATYTVYNILHSKKSSTDIINQTVQPFREIVCIPSTNTTLITNFEAFFNTWLPLTGNNAIIS